MKARKGYVHNIITLFIIFFVLVTVIKIPVMAADVTESGTSNIPQAIKEVESGVVKLLVYAADQSGNKYNIRQGTGILIGTEKEGK